MDRPRGSPERPLGPEELADKFRDCARRVLAPPQIDRAIALLGGLEAVPDVAALIEPLVPVA